jgi:hypothetical protein
MGKNLEVADSVLNDAEELALGGVLTHALPASLGTAEAPSRYTVLAAFNRPPLPREVTMIESAIGRMELAGAGYDSVTLTVAGRRLEIGDTNLDELKSGLATLVATMVHDASITAATQEAARRAGMTEENDRESRRADLISESASEVFFEQTPEARSSLIEAIERCYHNGEAAGQMWLHDLSIYLKGLPLDDPRLEALAARGPRQAVDDYLHAHAHPLASGLQPSAWLDAYLARPTTGNAQPLEGQPPTS